MMYKCIKCGTGFFHLYTTPKNWPKDEKEKDRFRLCFKHWTQKYNPEEYKKIFRKNKD